MKIPRSLYTLAPILLLATAAVAQDDLPDLTEVPDATGRPESTSSAEPTSTPTSEAASTTSDPPQQTENSDAAGFVPPTDLPTIAGALNPTVGVPYTANAPYMQKSSLPEGTVFICVGAALGFLGACILAWRGMVAWSLHRSVKRAGIGQTYVGESKPSLRGPSGGVYAGLPGDSTLSLNKPNLLNKKHLSATPSTFSAKGRAPSSLFFSPTAGTGHASQNRSSSYLPAGYYAAGASTTASGAPTTQIGGGPTTSSLGPSAAGYNRARSIGPSPPGSPALPPSRGYDRPPPSRGSNFDGYSRSSMVGNLSGDRGRSMYERPSTSSLNLSVQPTEGRTPSAYLEDLFENHGSGPRERY